MDFSLKFDKGTMALSIPERNYIGEILPNSFTPDLTGGEAVARALENPVGSKRLREIARPGERVIIVTSDITRPMPSALVLPAVLDELRVAGVSDGDITVVFALGIHRGHTEEEMRHLAGDAVFDAVRCVDSDPSDCVRLGVCANGTPVDVFREVARADRRVLLGNVEYHYFAGYSGGTKAIMPGVSSREAIQMNHRNMVNEKAVAGNLSGNPVRSDIDEVADFLPVDFIVNVVLDEKKRVIHAEAGHCIEAHRAACRFLDSVNMVEVERPADIVITSPGGFPKDINLYQAQKAIDNAKYIVRDGGIIILVASCREGFGEAVFERWIRDLDSPEARIKGIKEHFELGGHKAAAIALVQARATIFMVSDMDDASVRKTGMIPFRTLQEAADRALIELGPDAGAYLMPMGASTLPRLRHI